MHSPSAHFRHSFPARMEQPSGTRPAPASPGEDRAERTTAGKASCQPVLKGARWYAQNLLSELDVESEYYIDAQRKLLYFFPPQPIRPQDDGLAGGAFLSAGEHVITVENAAYIQFEGVAIVRTPPLAAGAHPF